MKVDKSKWVSCTLDSVCDIQFGTRIVKKQTGKTILEYGQSIYLDEAKQMLAETDKSISAIIEELGFSNRSHFYRLFKQAYGETPLDYRKRIRP